MRISHHSHESWGIITEVSGQESCLLLGLKEGNPLCVLTEESSLPHSGWGELGELWGNIWG